MSCLASGTLITASGQHLLKWGTYSNLYNGHSQFTCVLSLSLTHKHIVTQQRHQKQLYLFYFILSFALFFIHSFFCFYLFILSV